jgi:hypothetical protein
MINCNEKCCSGVVPLLCNDHEMGGYTRPLPGQRLGKHIHIPGQQILNNATVGL